MKNSEEGFLPIVGIIVASLILIPLSNNDGLSCGEGTVLSEGVCIVDNSDTNGVWVEIEFDFNSSEIHVNKGDQVRLYFNSTSWGHYVPDTLLIPEYQINASGLSKTNSAMIEFVAKDEGVYSYYSEGLCRVEIPGAGEVNVDCSIFCGEIDNARDGLLVVEGETNHHP